MNPAFLKVWCDLPPVLEFLAKATVLLTAAWAMHWALRGRNPRWRVLFWRGTMVGLAILPLLVFFLPICRITLPQTHLAAELSEAIPAAIIEKTQATSTVPIPADAIPATIVRGAEPRLSLAALCARRWALLVAIGWGLGSLLMLCHAFHAAAWVRRLRRRSEPIPNEVARLAERLKHDFGVRVQVRMLKEDGFASPILCGFWRPIILLPSHMSRPDYVGDLPAILAHEMGHVCSRDLFWMGLAQALWIVLWPHPFLWRARRACSVACELVADSIAVQYVRDARFYSQTLARVALEVATHPLPDGGLAMARLPEIRHRLNQVNRSIHFFPLHRWTVRLACLAGIGILVMLGGFKVVQAEPEGTRNATPQSHPANKPAQVTTESQTQARSTAPQKKLDTANFNLFPHGLEIVNLKSVQEFTTCVVNAVKTFLYPKGDESNTKSGGRKFCYDPNTFMLTVTDTPANIARVRQYIESLPELDRKTRRQEVIFLKHAVAEQLAAKLQQVFDEPTDGVKWQMRRGG